ncbi:MAG: hypothetical protein JXR37_08630 [Kiritimatiellae bacterium]|nr:hypothetical protein [Kiritimatiellia bacterium]
MTVEAPTAVEKRTRMRGEARERDLIRSLADRVAELAAEPRMAAIRRRWRDVNALRRPDRAPVWCMPRFCTHELIPPATLACHTPWLRNLEQQFKFLMLKREIDDDTPIEPHFPVGAVFDVDPPNTWGVAIGHIDSGRVGGAWAFDPPLKTEADFERLRMPRYTYNEARTHEKLGLHHDLFGDLLPVTLACGPPLHSILCNWAAKLRGLEQMMLDMVLAPEWLHRLMAHLRDAVLAGMEQVAATGLLTPNTEGAMYGSDPIGPAPAAGIHTYKNCWCASNAQECDQISPAMWEEFCLDYQKPIFARFGLVGYGCCENLTHKIGGVLSIPNLRMFVSSAWTDLDKVIEAVGTRYCIMWRQKASDVVFPDDTAAIERHLEDGTRRLRGHYYQIVLRELQTLAGHMDRLHVWTRLAKEAAARHA